MREDNREPLHNIRAPGELWERAKWAVKVRGDRSVSHIIRVFLTQYVQDTEKMVARKGRSNRGANREQGSNQRPRKTRGDT